jgi:class 3 adenylate cyclase
MTAILDDLETLVETVRPHPPEKTDKVTRTVVFFDLVGSTARKLAEGHAKGVAATTTHNGLCRAVSERFGGVVLKELGDGVLATFEDPLKAILAAENVRSGLALHTELSTKIGLTTGLVDLVEIDGRQDALGAVVDRAARIQAAASPNQIMIDTALSDSVGDYLGDIEGIRLGTPRLVPLRGIGDLELRPIASDASDAAPPRLPERLRTYGTGRLPIQDKLRFMSYAERDVIEFGTGLTTFAGYFTSLNPDVWKNPVRDMLARGVNLRCYALDPDSDAAKAYYTLRDEPDYPARAASALQELVRVRNEFSTEGLDGGLQLFLYGSLPAFYALAVDLDETQSGVQVSPYLPGVPRAECPVFEFSRGAEPALHSGVKRSLEAQMQNLKLIA